MSKPLNDDFPLDDKKVVLDETKVPAEIEAKFPEVVQRSEKGAYAKSISEDAPEPVSAVDDPGLHTAHGADARRPEVVVGDSPLYTVGGEGHGDGQSPVTEQDHDLQKDKQNRRICGIPMRTFWLLILVIVILLIGIGIGAGVGTALSKKSKNKTDSNSPSAVPAANGTQSLSPSKTVSTASRTSSSPTPSRVDFRDIGYNLTVWEGKNYTGRWQYVDRVGWYRFGFSIASYWWRCGTFTSTEMCSFSLCQNETYIGWHGGQDHQVPSFETDYPDRVKIACGALFENPWCSAEATSTTTTVFATTVPAPTPPPDDAATTTAS